MRTAISRVNCALGISGAKSIINVKTKKMALNFIPCLHIILGEHAILMSVFIKKIGKTRYANCFNASDYLI